jgi:hypothetical protein
MTSKDWYEILEHEFSADDGSFLLQMRCDLVWNREAFTRLTEAMLACCQVYDNHSQQPTLPGFGLAYDRTYLPRWIADGFWYCATYIEGFTSHPAWSEKIAAGSGYYEKAYERLRDLAQWFFSGECGYLNPAKQFASM